MVTKFTYSGNPSASEKDEVRFRLGDTDSANPMLGDAEIKYLISSEGSAISAAVAGALALAAKFSSLCDEEVGDLSAKYSQKADNFKKLADELKKLDTYKCIAPYAGGISEAEKETVESDSDRVKPAFTKELHNSVNLSPETLFKNKC